MSEACAYLVSRYPSVTHTFIADEVQGLRTVGVRVETATVRRVDRGELLSEADHAEDAATYALLPTTLRVLVRCHARAALRSPRAYAATLSRALRAAHAGGRARLWQAFYFAEAILLWDWMEARRVRHVRVHHANVAADVAMLACAFANGAGADARWTWSLTIHGPTELLDVTTHKLALKAADAAAVICTSDFARSQVTALLPTEHLGGVHTVRCGIDITAFRPSEHRRDGGPATILCVAALSRRKGHRFLIDALARLRDDGVAARLTLVGDGPERDALQARATALGIAADVDFVGAVGYDQVARYYAAADIFCLPSFAEGLPTVLLEAMAAALPVVATSVMGVPELVDDERTGLLVAPARADQLASALARLVADPELRARLGAQARRRVESDYDGARQVRALRDVLSPLVR